MAKTKTSKKRSQFSGKDLPVMKVNPRLKVDSHRPEDNLTDPAFITSALAQCLIEGDVKTFKEILLASIEAMNISELAERTKIGRRTIYHALSKEGNPRLETVLKLTQEMFKKGA